MKQNIISKAVLLGAAVGLLTQSSYATLTWSSPLTLSTPGIVGVAYGVTGSGQGSDPFLFTVAQDLLNLSANQDVTMNISGTSTEFKTSTTTDYNGTVITSGTTSGGAGVNVTLASNYDFAIAKYDGQNAGYILFYLGGQAANLPQYPADFWTSNTDQYQISGWTEFNVTNPPGINLLGSPSVPEPSTVVAGALLLLPLGVSVVRILRKSHTT